MIKPKQKAAEPFNAERARGFTDRVAKLVEEQKAIGADISDVCKEAKDFGLDPATIRWSAREKLMDASKRAARDEKRDLYLHALGMAVAAVESGEMSARQSAKIYNIGKSSIYKELAVREVSTVEMTDADLGEWLPPHDAETGEIPREMTADDLGDPLLVVDKPRGEFREKVRKIAASVPRAILEAPVPIDTRTPAEIMGEMPAHLRRERAPA